ncbi:MULTISPECIES: glycosyltransferase [unclassified Providencia]|uniref:glycosyltransferase n=1 Tax=unclassified Providencia TaxID=2633465 RepID=UPI0023490268|nr:MULTISPECIES: glycosyltransferase [unclassified Providencia]HBK4773416.1 glycosyltransferase [Providencia rettgeri]
MSYQKNNINLFVLDITLKGGIERFSINLANSLSKYGYTVKIYSLHKSNKGPLYLLSNNVKIEYINNYKKPSTQKYKLTTLYSCYKLKKMNAILNKNCTNISTHPITTILLRVLGFNMSNLIASEHSSYNSHGKFVCLLRKWAYSKVKKIVTQTKSGYNSFKNINLDSTLIYNSTVNFNDLDQWKLNSSNDFICITIARIEPVKQLEIFLHIAREIKERKINIKFKIIGDGSEKEKLKALSINLGLEDIVEFYPATSDVYKYYKNASLYIITSKSESFSMTMTEAMSYSIPVISNKSLIGPSEVIIHNINGFLCKDNDVNQFSDYIQKVYESNNLISLRKNALNTSKNFHEDEIIKKWIEIL